MQTWWTALEHRLFEKSLNQMDALFDDHVGLLRQKVAKRAYTNFTDRILHPSRESLVYAVALLDSGDKQAHERSKRILAQVINLQDTEPTSPTCGLWPWYLEEPLDEMPAVDPNWADFCSVQLIQVLLDHKQRLPASLVSRIETSLFYACMFIMKRDVTPGYTNIALMGTYSMLLGGMLLHRSDFHTYGEQRMINIHEFITKQGGFMEYNSPTYTAISLRELGRVVHHGKGEVVDLAKDLFERLWIHWGRRFHVPTLQLAGPHSRAYHDLLEPSRLSFTQWAVGSRWVRDEDLQIGTDYLRIPLFCPKHLWHYFKQPFTERTEHETFLAVKGLSLLGTTYLTNEFSLGSVNYGSMWSQNRNMMLYWGRYPQVGYLKFRATFDGEDLPEALFSSVQQDGSLLFGVNFLQLNRSQKGKSACLRIGFELGGCLTDMEYLINDWTEGHLRFAVGDIEVDLLVVDAAFGEVPLSYGIDENDGFHAYLDFCNVSLDDLTDVDQAYMVCAVKVGSKLQPGPLKIIRTCHRVEWENVGLSLDIRQKPLDLTEIPKPMAEVLKQLN